MGQKKCGKGHTHQNTLLSCARFKVIPITTVMVFYL
nr:MAG TPA: hypothetical protein [Caudoviricetes sp.]